MAKHFKSLRLFSALTSLCCSFGLAGCGQDTSRTLSTSGSAPTSPWEYQSEVDPITRKTTTKVVAQLKLKTSLDEPVITNVIWDCKDGTTQTLQVEMVTFQNVTDDQGKLKPLAIDGSRPLEFRMNGIATSVEPGKFLYNIMAKREYENSVELLPLVKEGLYGRYRYTGLYTAKGRDADGDMMYDTVAFYLVDPEFVVRIATASGSNEVVSFSLDDPSIKKLFTQCGVTYGPPPSTPSHATKLMSWGMVMHPTTLCATSIPSQKMGPILIGAVRRGSASERAGIRAGDILLKVGQKPLKSMQDAQTALSKAKPGSSVDVVVLHDGSERTLTAQFLAVDAASLPENQPSLEMQNSQDVDNQNLRKQLLTMGAERSRSKDLDQKHLEQIKEILKSSGWPTPAMVGGDASTVALTIAFGDVNEPEFQRVVFAMIEPLAKSCKVRPGDYAAMYDRTHVPQRYGTVGQCRSPGHWEADEIDDTQSLDRRRSELGVSSMNDWLEIRSKMCL